jgi:ABC-type multidrug transport system ATPase subunit
MKIGVVPQFDNLDPDFTAAENLIVYGRYFGMRMPKSGRRSPSCSNSPASPARKTPTSAPSPAA